jgi:hypothetical protein
MDIKLTAVEEAPHEPAGCVTDDDSAGVGHSLQASCYVGRFAER